MLGLALEIKHVASRNCPRVGYVSETKR